MKIQTGDFGTYSFYFSHHITSGEGGMVVCHTLEDYNFLRSLRAHGWTRHLTNRDAVEKKHADIDPRFLFVTLGYNLRPMEVQGAMIRVQLRKLTEFNNHRRENYSRIKAALESGLGTRGGDGTPGGDGVGCEKDDESAGAYGRVFRLMQPAEGTDPAWFGLALLLHRPYAHQLGEYISYLNSCGVENRPIISGNFLRQPCLRNTLATSCEGSGATSCAGFPQDFPGAEVRDRSFASS